MCMWECVCASDTAVRLINILPEKDGGFEPSVMAIDKTEVRTSKSEGVHASGWGVLWLLVCPTIDVQMAI